MRPTLEEVPGTLETPAASASHLKMPGKSVRRMANAPDVGGGARHIRDACGKCQSPFV